MNHKHYGQPDEFSKIKKSCFAIVDQVEQGTSKKFCTRGLERYLAHTRREFMERRHSALDSVFDEQRHHRRRDSLVDDEHMARLYKFSTFQNRRNAFVRAKQDEVEIKKYLRRSTRRSASYRNLLKTHQSFETIVFD